MKPFLTFRGAKAQLKLAFAKGGRTDTEEARVGVSVGVGAEGSAVGSRIENELPLLPPVALVLL